MSGQTIYYAVKYGRKPGVYNVEDEFKKQVLGFEGAYFDEFQSKKEALAFLGLTNEKQPKKLECATTNFVSSLEGVVAVYVDGSYLPEHNVYGGAFVVVKNGIKINEGYEPGTNETVAKELTSVAGELKGTMLGVRYAVQNAYKKVIIHYDDMRIMKLAVGEAKPNNGFLEQYVSYINAMKMKYDLQIDFVKVKAHKGNVWNGQADKLAKKAAKEALRIKGINILPEENNIKFPSNAYLDVYKSYKKGFSFKDILEHKKLKENKLASALIKCKIMHPKLCLNAYIKLMNQYQETSISKEVLEYFNQGLSLEDILEETGYKINVIITALVICFANNPNLDLDEFLSRGNEVEKDKEDLLVNQISNSSNSPSHIQTYSLYKQGYSIKEISETRNLKESTIYSHLTKCYAEGAEINFEGMYNNDYEIIILTEIKNSGFNVSKLKRSLPISVTYGDILLVGAKHGYNQNMSA